MYFITKKIGFIKKRSLSRTFPKVFCTVVVLKKVELINMLIDLGQYSKIMKYIFENLFQRAFIFYNFHKTDYNDKNQHF